MATKSTNADVQETVGKVPSRQARTGKVAI